MKKKTIALVSGAVLLSGCGEEETKIVYKDPTPEQIQAAVDQALLKLNKEQEELKSFLAEIQKTNPDVVGARYAYEDGEKVMKIAMEDPQHTSSLMEYALPVATGALAGYAGARLAQRLTSYTHRSGNGYGKCDLTDLLTGDRDCRQGYKRTSPSFFHTYPSYRYADRSAYRTITKKERKIYSAKVSRKSANERATLIKNRAKTTFNHTATNSHATKTGSHSTPKATLSQSRQAFSTKRSTSRSSSMSWGSSSSRRSWGG